MGMRYRGDTKAIVFDFDGLILDTEMAEWEAWHEIYTEYGCTLPFSLWVGRVGTSSERFNPLIHLEQVLGESLPHTQIQQRRRERLAALLIDKRPFPGVVDYLEQAHALSLHVGLASASPQRWVRGHLSRLGLESYFDQIYCAEQVQYVKPHPEAYQRLTTDWQIEPAYAIALDDSPHGIWAVKRAGLISVAVPNSLTVDLNFEHSDLILHSLSQMPLIALLNEVDLIRHRLS